MMTVVTGGSGSGKSAFAEDCILKLDPNGRRRIYIATMHPYDEESKRRVIRHREMRADKQFETIEKYTNIGSLSLPSDSVILLECMSNLAANEMFETAGAGEETVSKIISDLTFLKKQAEHLVIVTNEIFSEAAAYEGDTRTYQRYLGQINQLMAEMADEVYEVVFGIPVCLKGGALCERNVEQF